MRYALYVTTLYCVLYFITLTLVANLHGHWWHKVWLRRLLYGQFSLGLVGSSLWLLSRPYELTWLLSIGWGLFAVLFLIQGSFLIALLLITPTVLGSKLYDRLRPGPQEAPTSLERRHFLRRSLAVVPALGVAGVGHGIYASGAQTRIPVIPLNYPHLPADLEGLKILQISDMHIGPYIQLSDLEKLLERAGALAPDLILVTGDICDHKPDYLAALRLLESARAPLGVYASLGNHEYIRGIGRIRGHFDKTTIPLLVDEGLSIPVGEATLFLGGVDDPRILRSEESYQHLQNSVEKAVGDSTSDAFTLLMSHRSQALDYAVPLGGVDLILAGHTHGFQCGIAGRSALEPFFPERYIWGHYAKEQTQLYTTAGVGHWLPFRFGCPPEAPLFTLHRS
jgi:predicted MPP superfamily phosphohydrolase